MYCAILKALHGFQEKRAHKSRDMQFFLQNFQNEIFNIFKMFKNNMKFIGGACWINSKISNNNRDKNTTLIIFFFCHYCWSLLWFNYSLQSGSYLSKKLFYLLQWKLFKSDEKCFLFHLKILLVINIYHFCADFLDIKNGFIRKISKLMVSQPVTLNVLRNISRSEGNQIMKCDQVTEYNKRNIFLQKSCRKWGRETSPRPLCFLKKRYIR